MRISVVSKKIQGILVVSAAGLSRIPIAQQSKAWHAVFLVRCSHRRSFGYRLILSSCLVGAGEYITRSTLARAIGEALEISDDTHNILHQILLNRFWSGSL